MKQEEEDDEEEDEEGEQDEKLIKANLRQTFENGRSKRF